jgi:hypothetical protein
MTPYAAPMLPCRSKSGGLRYEQGSIFSLATWMISIPTSDIAHVTSYLWKSETPYVDLGELLREIVILYWLVYAVPVSCMWPLGIHAEMRVGMRVSRTPKMCTPFSPVVFGVF